ncbi:maestro heat-like repeat-containing protein family member 2B [Dromaius novaehollandiae]|uniref:maestro heat-like repeat-containing protein family member 2B n=1 Tax=Dromaius novaehollandiae TaxID=8790 RepID=UPI00311E7D46
MRAQGERGPHAQGALCGQALGFGPPGAAGQPLVCPQRGRACEWFGSLAGLLGPLTCDTSAASRWWAVTCLGHLLRTGAENTDVAPWTNEIGRLRERLSAVTSESLLATSTNIAKLVCKYFPRGQASGFMSSIVESLLCTRPVCAWAAERWTLTFLGDCGEQIFQEEVPKLVHLLYTCLRSTRQSARRCFVLRAVFLLAHSHPQPVLDSLLQACLPTDSDMVEVWRSLGRSVLGCQILVCLTEKLRAAGKSSHRSECCTRELGSSQAALEPRTVRSAAQALVPLHICFPARASAQGSFVPFASARGASQGAVPGWRQR